MSGTTSAGPAARKSRARDARKVSAGRRVTPAFMVCTTSAPGIVAHYWQRHAPRPASTTNELASFKGDGDAVTIPNTRLACQKIAGGDDLKPHLFHLSQ